ncbi:hypothetical protein [Nocardia arthritidis]|uniref:Lipoprotein n=1 Tax=Nocardia arthritidis TaxID=228602 RepID=A0A6G9YND1_9NOCA|nr:hypothetical protein [Nocardia arthritidis]QIS14433.1 hypothetical protein F5544_32980 [Nocardia arthritidis]
MSPVRGAAALGALALLAALTGCGSGDNSNPLPATPTTHPDFSITFSSPSATKDRINLDQVTPEAEKQLCDMIGPETGNWRNQEPGVGKVSFNVTVHDWAARNGGLNDLVIKDRTVVDRITDQMCPDIRRQALSALQVGELADALAGFGR